MRENRLYGSVGGWGLNRPPPTQSTCADCGPGEPHHDLRGQSLTLRRKEDRDGRMLLPN